MIELIFVICRVCYGLAHNLLHCVTGLILPPVDASPFFPSLASACWRLGECIGNLGPSEQCTMNGMV